MKQFYILLLALTMANYGFGQIISQYIETNSGTTPKGIEIWNNTGASLDFSINNLVIEKSANGGVASADFTLSSGSLASGDVIVIGTSDLETVTIANGSSFYVKGFSFNGDDGLVVKYGGTTTDVFGDPGTGDPGTGWSGSGVQTWNQNIELNSGITTGDVDGWTDPSTRFSVVNTDPFGANGDEGFGIAPVSESSNDSESDIIEAGFDEPDNIDYTTYSVASGLIDSNALKIGEFTVRDGGATPGDADTVDTVLTDLELTITGSANIAALALFSGPANVSETTTVSGTTTFSNINAGSGLIALDDGDLTFGVYATFKSNVTDNEQIQITISSATADGVNGSSFSSLDAGGATTSIVGDDNKIEVTASKLIFSQQPPIAVGLNQVMADVIVEAQDANDNVDADYTSSIDITSTGTLDTSPVSETTVAGVATFNTITHTAIGSGLVLTADDSSFPTVNSSSFEVVVLPTTIAIEDFDGSTPSWSYTTSIPFFGSTSAFGGDFYGIIDISDASPLDYSNFSNNILGENDLNSTNGTSGFATTTFSSIDISLYNDIVLTFDWDISGYNASTDDARYQVFYDGVGQGIQYLVDGGVDNLNGEGTVSLNIPNTLSTVYIEIEVRNDGGSGYSGFDNFKLTGFLPSIVYEGNNSNGFGGPLGEGDLEITAFTGTTADFTFIKGTGDFNDFIVIYLDSQSGGFTTTGNLTDTGDDHRKAISGYDGTNRSIIDFPPGFKADYAIAINQGSASLFQLFEGVSYGYVADLGLTPTGTTAASYDFSVNFSDINSSAGAESFKFLATYLNAGNAFRSNEFIGRTIYDNNATGNPGNTTVDMQTYYQVSSHKQGGVAPTAITGLWTDDATWLNGNPPLDGDEIILNNDITLNTDYSLSQLPIGTHVFTIASGSTLTTLGEISGSGSFNVEGKLSITDGGFTTITPNYSGLSTLEYKDITGIYNRSNEWNVGTTVGSGVPNNVIIDNVDLDLTDLGGSTADEAFNVGYNLSIINNGNINIDASKSLSIGNDLDVSGGSLELNSTSIKFSNLIVTGTVNGNVSYNRWVDSDTNGRDLISPPVSGQAFNDFFTANISNLVTGTGGAVLFGPFDNAANPGVYVNYLDSETATLDKGVGYRTASNSGSTLNFTGIVETGDLTGGSAISITDEVGNYGSWNLIGNPYPSYLSFKDFYDLILDVANSNTNNQLDPSYSGIYGYDSDAVDGSIWAIWDLNNANYATDLITPGQGFFVKAKSLGGSAEFTSSMRRIGTGDDFIANRMDDVNVALAQLNLVNGSSAFSTNLYFRDGNTLGLDPGYDTGAYGGSANGIFTNLVEDNIGVPMANQSVPYSAMNDVVIPLGINASQGEQISIGLNNASTLPANINVYLEDNITNIWTLLNTGDYTLTPTTDLAGTGRFFVHFSSTTLSVDEMTQNGLLIYAPQTSKTIVVQGVLQDTTTVTVFDIQGRVVLQYSLISSSTANTIDTNRLNSGVYIVKLKNKIQNKTQKIILR